MSACRYEFLILHKNEQSQMEIKKAIPVIIASKRMKY
jgi:hypothetical protein